MAERQFKRLGGDTAYWIPENSGEAIEGKYVEEGTMATAYGDMQYIVLEDDQGVRKQVGVSAGLVLPMTQVKLGDYLRIVYQGERFNRNTKRRFKSFEVYQA